MEGAGAVLAESFAVFGGGVAFVRGEAVLGVEEVEFAHEGVAMNFCEDAGGGDGEGEGVAVEELGLGAGVVDVESVDEQVVGSGGELLDGEQHGEAGGLVDVDAVDGIGVDFGDGEAEGRSCGSCGRVFRAARGLTCFESLRPMYGRGWRA